MDSNKHHSTCQSCGITKFEGRFYWSYQPNPNQLKEATPVDLAGLVCQHSRNKELCINPCKRGDLGDSWETRNNKIDKLLAENEINFS